MKATIQTGDTASDRVVVFDDAPDALWSNPKPLPDARPPVPTFKSAVLPDVVRPWVEDVSERLQCAPDYAAVGTMVALSSVIGRRVGICPKRHDDWLVVPSLWGGIVGRPGIMKTPALAEAMRPLRRLEAESLGGYREALSAHELDAIQREAQAKALKQKLAATAKNGRDMTALIAEMAELREQDKAGPVCVRYETNDATVEKLGELLAENPQGLLMFRDELVGWLRNLDKQGHEGARAFFLEAWDGKSGFTYDRIGRGTVRIEAACVSILGGIQPGPLAHYVREAARSGAGADGLLQRFQMVVYPDEPSRWRNVDRWADSTARNSAFSAFQKLAFVDAQSIGADMSGDIPFFRFEESAQEAFTEWRMELETVKLRADEPEMIEAHLSKYRSLVPSLALICHLTDGGTGPVSELAMIKAAAWAEYLESHARRIYSLALDDNVALCALAHRIQAGDVKNGFTPKEVYDHHWRALDAEATRRAVDGLEALDWLRAEEVSTGGRPSTRCWINPRVEVSR